MHRETFSRARHGEVCTATCKASLSPYDFFYADTWTSANRVTDFYLTSASEEAPLTASDMIGFVPSTAMCSMATSATYTANAKNVVVEADDYLP